MIKVIRGSLPKTIQAFHVKSVLAADGITMLTKANDELERAVRFCTDPKHYLGEKKLIKKEFSFTVYKDPELAALLEIVFNNKCAYCESRFAHVTPKEVEHFRPKGSIDTGSGTLRPGYYWLAATWDNLLVSCPHCNRRQNHKVPNQPKTVLLGKGSQFPLSDERRRVRRSRSLRREEEVRLLLNPCIEDPEKYLTFDERGLIHSRKVKASARVMAETSIAVYALQRKQLVEERLRVLNDLRFLFQQLEVLVSDAYNLALLKAPANMLTEKKEQMHRVKEKVQEMFRADAPYLAMLRNWIRTNHKRGELAKLRRFGIDPLKFL